MKPTPEGWPRISAAVFYRDPHAAIDWLVRVFGFELRMKAEGPDGTLFHSELTFGDGLIMVGQVGLSGELPSATPVEHDGVITQAQAIFVDDVDAHCEHARAEGATIGMEPRTDDYGEEYWCDRTYRAIDLEGHHWWFMHRLRG